jgi:hypothetical protein
MGGGYYDRDVGVADNSAGYSAAADKVLAVNTEIHKSLHPNRYAESPMISTAKHPVVFALDVTGSMGTWPKIIYDKMPMFYGQIMTQKYLSDPSISFCAIGDGVYDKAPLQVAEFGQGMEIDQLIAKLWLEGGGGGNGKESYELAAYFYDRHVDISASEIPFFFVTGDEDFFTEMPKTLLAKFGFKEPSGSFEAGQAWAELKKKYNVFHVRKRYEGAGDKQIGDHWKNVLGEERVLPVTNPKAVIDVILGAIAITSGSRNLQTYIEDMKERGQDKERIDEVAAALKHYNSSFSPKKVVRNKSSVVVEEEKEIQPVVSAQFQKIQSEFEFKEQLQVLSEEQKLFKTQLKDLKAVSKSKIPPELACPLTGSFFFDPVIAEDGHTYERNAITAWLDKYDASPLETDQKISKTLLPNNTVKKLVKRFYDDHYTEIKK